MEIEILSYGQYLSSLRSALNNSSEIRGTTAFWTLNEAFEHNYLSNKLRRVLSNEKSFFCCDVSTYATDIDAIDSLAKYGCNFWFYTYKLSKSLEKYPPSLLHSKILLLKQQDNTTLVFIGSHNMTNRAMKGFNTEHTILIKCNDDAFLSEIEHELKLIKRKCIEYRPELKQIFKWLQDGVDIEDQLFVSMLFVNVPESSFSRITADNVFVFVSFDSLEFEDKNVPDLKERDRLLNLFVYTDSGKIQIYEVELIHTGTTDVDNDSTKINSEGADYFGLWIRSLSFYAEIPIFSYPVNNLTSNIFNIDNTHYYRVKIIRAVNEIYKVNTGKGGFRSKLNAWETANDEEYLHSFFEHRQGFKNQALDNTIDISNHGDAVSDKKNGFEAKLLKINQDIFSEDFLVRMFEKNKSAFTELEVETMIDLSTESYNVKKGLFNDIRRIIFESLNAEKKIEQIRSFLFDSFKGYENALQGESRYKGIHLKYFRNMRDKYFNR
jgi:hypothetical protein